MLDWDTLIHGLTMLSKDQPTADETSSLDAHLVAQSIVVNTWMHAANAIPTLLPLTYYNLTFTS